MTLLEIGSLVCNLILAPVALYVAWDVQRRTTRHILKVVDASTILHDTMLPQRRCYFEFQVYFKNVGLSLPGMSVSISFLDDDLHGRISCPLRWVDICTGQSEKAAAGVVSGQVVKFAWRTYEMSDTEARLLASLVDLRKQDASLNVFSSGYIVKSIPLGSLRLSARCRLQEAAWRVYPLLRLGSACRTAGSWRAKVPIPRIDKLIRPVNQFLAYIREPNWRERLHDVAVRQTEPTGSPSSS